MSGQDWIEWSGGECPVEPNALVEVKYRDGDWEAISASGAISKGVNWWKHTGDADQEFNAHGCDIIAYRVVKP